ncbi:hypothetical protein J2W30_004543 [Variovorax boronicumulans]|uniref:DUF6493 family protein n=1 Tax=Variovorax boronicumulans TaxID=436515 RepID=UPI0027867E0D|nr:DUF6493 family protein [Variovorax boronicumulans]MDQ0036768.1 hypothetical protein [Variovorax boronicumulans]
MSHDNVWDWYRDLGRLVMQGASLQDLHASLCRIRDAGPHLRDGSPACLRQLATTWTQRPAFVPIRLAELFEGQEVAHSDDYVLAMVAGLGGRHEWEVRAFMLRHDRALREETFWRIFEVEGGGEISLANVDKFSREEGNWHHTVVDLVADGTLDRARVLRACLQALNRDFSAYRAGWFSRVYAALAPSAQEAAADQALLRLGLVSPITATVSLAVAQLAAVHKAGLLEADAFIEAAPAALAGGKASALAVLRVLGALGAAAQTEGKGGHARRADAAAQVIAQGTAHPHADVQRATLAALAKLGRTELVVQASASLSPAVAAELAPEAGAAASLEAPSSASYTVPAAAPVRPFTDDDAVARWAALLETPRDAIEFELGLAWLAGPAAAGAPPLAERLAPLRKRALKLAQRDSSHFPAVVLAVVFEPANEFLPQTYYQSTTTFVRDGQTVVEQGERQDRPTAEQSSVLPSFVVRLREVAAILQGRAARRPLLATPTDTHGRVEAEVLLERLAETRQLGQADASVAPLSADLQQALLRVPPDALGQVLAAAAVAAPLVTEALRIEWRSRGSETLKANGSPQWVWWDLRIHADPSEQPSAADPALIPSSPMELWRSSRVTTDLVTHELALVHPPSTLRLTAVGLELLNHTISGEVEHHAAPLLEVLAAHPGTWTAETVQLVALGMSAGQAPLRAQAAELLVAAVPARLAVAEAARGFADCAPACVPTRWAASFTDVARIDPGLVVQLLGALLPRLDRATRGIGALLTVLLDESLRIGAGAPSPALREWLASFTGASAAAKAAKALLR